METNSPFQNGVLRRFSIFDHSSNEGWPGFGLSIEVHSPLSGFFCA
jgi:hypothetical protein